MFDALSASLVHGAGAPGVFGLIEGPAGWGGGQQPALDGELRAAAPDDRIRISPAGWRCSGSAPRAGRAGNQVRARDPGPGRDLAVKAGVSTAIRPGWSAPAQSPSFGLADVR
jgi:hypothetical protein